MTKYLHNCKHFSTFSNATCTGVRNVSGNAFSDISRSIKKRNKWLLKMANHQISITNSSNV